MKLRIAAQRRHASADARMQASGSSSAWNTRSAQISVRARDGTGIPETVCR
jgi:hypothetical protein